MRLGMMLFGLVAFSGAVFLMQSDQTGNTSRFNTSGAKSVTVGARQSAPESRSMVEYAYDLAHWMSGADAGRSGSDLASMKARHQQEKNPMNAMSFDDMATLAQDAMRMANEAGVPTGPTAFDPYLERKARAGDAIGRLDDGLLP